MTNDLEKLAADARHALALAKKTTEDYLKAAEAKCTADLENSYEYKFAVQDADMSNRHLQSVRLIGDTNPRMQASAYAARASAKVKQMRELAFANCDAVQDARRLMAAFATNSRLSDGKASSPADEILKAIRERRLIEGMTIAEAERAAGKKAEVMDSDGGMTRYRWRIMGVTGSTTHSWTDALGHARSEQVAVRGELAQVQASFIDGKLVSFERINERYSGYGE